MSHRASIMFDENNLGFLVYLAPFISCLRGLSLNEILQEKGSGVFRRPSVSSSSMASSPFLNLQFSSSSSVFYCPFSVSSNLLSVFSPPKIASNTLKTYPKNSIPNPLITNPRSPSRLTCRAAEYKFPDPIPEFAEAETDKFKKHMLSRLTKKKEELFGDSVEEVVGICTEIFNTFLHKEYGGPGTLLVMPFIDMADTLNERGLPGGPQAARAAVKWATKHVDKDWKEWNENNNNS